MTNNIILFPKGQSQTIGPFGYTPENLWRLFSDVTKPIIRPRHLRRALIQYRFSRGLPLAAFLFLKKIQTISSTNVMPRWYLRLKRSIFFNLIFQSPFKLIKNLKKKNLPKTQYLKEKWEGQMIVLGIVTDKIKIN